ncbi:outer membrane beta-barrel protein [Chitinophaga qingshengii]|uniref:Outer membrane beta-barrel protein n=1 Tax=Chitinophaga qingshengii TaxID=1569794 RepID=A0ABR7TSG7_9BACT|nr:autotransporter domain-containing protein [Chitinophaga qingshengii]MBC9933421.1 outer membrane beta-barrel protein [Chitinophaga qingshengii]
MKKFIIPVLAAATFLAGGQLFAQQKKNFINASFNVSNEKYKYTANGNQYDNSNTNFSISPAYGYYFRERWAIGIAVGYGHSKKGSSENGPQTKTQLFSVSPFVRYEQPIWSSHLSVYTDGSLYFNSAKSDSYHEPNWTQDSKSTNYGLSIVPGLLFHLTPSFSLTANMGSVFAAGSGTQKQTGGDFKTTNTSVGLFKNFGFNNFTFGINFHF